MEAKPFLRGAWKAGFLPPILAFAYFLRRTHYSPAYAIAGILMLIAAGILAWRWDRAGKSRLGAVLLAVSAAVLALPGVLQYLELRDPGDVDMACYVCALWNMAHGSTRYSIADMDIFGSHANYTVVLWLPVHMLAGGLGLKIGKILCLLWTVWLAARRRGEDFRATSWAGLALLLSPSIASQFFFGFHPEFLAAPVLVLAMHAYRAERLGRFLACTAFASFSKEVFTLAIGGLLLLALLERRSWKWWLLPGVLCAAQMFLYWFVIMPAFAPEGFRFMGALPASFPHMLEMLSRRRALAYYALMVLPFLPLLWAAPKRYLVAPVPLMLFYAAFPDELLDFWRHYQFPVAILLMGGFILGEKNAIRGSTLAACALLSLLCYPLWINVASFPRIGSAGPEGGFARARAVGEMRAMVPDSASVLVNGPFTTRFAGRKEVMDWVYKAKPYEAFDYVVLDARFHPEWLGRRELLLHDVDSLGTAPGWNRVFARDSLFLFRRAPYAGAP
jgi:predicted membrane protein DUF2079